MNDLQQIQFHCRYLRTKLITKYWKIKTILNTGDSSLFSLRICAKWCNGSTENARPENDGPSKSWGVKM